MREPLKSKEFTALVEGMLAEDYGEMSLDEFGAVMDVINETAPEVRVRIGVKMENGHLMAYGPDGRLLPNNTLRVGIAEIALEAV